MEELTAWKPETTHDELKWGKARDEPKTTSVRGQRKTALAWQETEDERSALELGSPRLRWARCDETRGRGASERLSGVVGELHEGVGFQL